VEQNTLSVQQFVHKGAEEHNLRMNDNERKSLQHLNAVADSSSFAKIEDIHLDFDSSLVCTMPQTSFTSGENLLISAMLSSGSTVFYRIYLCKRRAEVLAYNYYKCDTKLGKKGDAFKHILVNVLLKHYTSESIAYAVMDLYWENRGNNAPCDTYMDLHNNYVGRIKYYDYFTMGTDDWEQWGTRIHSFIESPSNSVKKTWTPLVPANEIKKEESLTNKSKYIYWSDDNVSE
jgi:hypothetical protein